MTTFLRLLADEEKADNLLACCIANRKGGDNHRLFEVESISFRDVPGAPFAYWVSETVRRSFLSLECLEADGREARIGPSTGDDDRYVRAYWEVSNKNRAFGRWVTLNKGGSASKFYFDYYLVIDWDDERRTFRGFTGRPGRQMARPNGLEHFFKPGITWPLRTQSGFNPRVVPSEIIFTHKGPTITTKSGEDLFWILGLTSSRAFELFVSIQISFGSYEVGAVQKSPIPKAQTEVKEALSNHAFRAWSLKRTLDKVDETSHAFDLPSPLRSCLDDYDSESIEAELADIQEEIDEIAFGLYEFSDADRDAALGSFGASEKGSSEESRDIYDSDDDCVTTIGQTYGLLSWSGGVAFGRFDWRLATGEREVPPDPEPFDPLPAKSPGMLPDGDEPYHRHAGILVDDAGHEHDLPRLMADVLETVDAQVDEDLRRWLRRDFFKYHLQQYSKSRRKAPIYWSLATASGSYTLWLYYPDLTDQTLFTAVNDFVEPKLKQVDSELGNLRLAGASRSRADEKRLEELSDFRDELADLRDTLLRIAPGYNPNHDDGVQITAAPLWPLFRHKPWQKVLKETWEKLEQGDYDWAHLAMAYWPERVREKCVTDKSLAIAHDLEHLFVEPEPTPKKTRGRKKASDG